MAEHVHNPASDEALLRRFARQGDQEAFRTIVERHGGAVLATCQRVLRDRALAEDAAQETFFRLLRSPESVEQSLGGWLHRAATRLCIDVVRRDHRRRAWEAEHSRRRATIEAATWADARPHVDEAIAELDDEAGWVLVEHYLRGRPLRELAEERGVSTATLSRRHTAALAALRGALRRRGVLTTVAVLAGGLATERAEALTAPVWDGVSRMAMLDGASRGAAMVGMPPWLAPVAVVLMVGAVVVAGGLWLAPRSRVQSPVVDEPRAAAAVAPVAAHGASSPARYLAAPRAGEHLDSARVVMVQDPATSGGRDVAVVFADNHVRTLPVAEARRLVREQTGLALEDLTPVEAP